MLELGRFRLPWDDGWSAVHDGDVYRYQGPGPTYLTADVLDQRAETIASEHALRERWTRYATEELPRIVGRHGRVVIPLSEERSPSGYRLFSIAGSSIRRGREYFLLLFVSLSPEGRFVQLALEGTGNPAERYAHFRSYVAAGRWKTRTSE